MARHKSSEAGRGRRKRKNLPLVVKLFLAGLFVAATLIVFAVASKIVRPFRLWFVEQQSISKQESQLASLNRENADLKLKKQYLLSPAGAENESRMLGYVKPGEVTVVVEPDKPKPDKDHKKKKSR